MSNKFATKYKNKFDELKNKLKNKREEAENRANGGGYDDSWKFKPTLPQNKPKVTYKVRILPNVHSDAIEPWIKANFHMFRRPDGKFIYTLCPTTFVEDPREADCPICDKSKKLFNSKDSMDEKKAKDLWRKPRYFVNVLVKKDTRKGEESQEGKVLVWEFGNQIFEKLVEALIEDDIDFSNPIEGVDFNLILKKKGEYTNYESSHFGSETTSISDDEDEMNEVYDSIYNLDDKILGTGAKSTEKLLEMLTGESAKEETGSTTRDSSKGGDEEDDDPTDIDDDDDEEEGGDEDDFDFDFDDD